MSLSQADKALRLRELHAGPRAFVIANAFDAGSTALLDAARLCRARDLERRRRRRARQEGWPAVARRGACARAGDCRGDRAAGLCRSRRRLRRFARRRRRDDPARRCHRHRRRVDRGSQRREGHAAVPDRSRRARASRAAVARGAVAAVRGFAITARAENFFRGYPDLADTIARLKAYEAAGADVLFAPALPDLDAVRAVCAAVTRPVNFMVGMKGKSFRPRRRSRPPAFAHQPGDLAVASGDGGRAQCSRGDTEERHVRLRRAALGQLRLREARRAAFGASSSSDPRHATAAAAALAVALSRSGTIARPRQVTRVARSCMSDCPRAQWRA